MEFVVPFGSSMLSVFAVSWKPWVGVVSEITGPPVGAWLFRKTSTPSANRTFSML